MKPRLVRIILPPPLRTLAHVTGDLQIEMEDPVTAEAIVERIEARFPMLAGTIRDHHTRQRRAYLRFFAAGKDVSMEPLSAPVPQSVAEGKEPFIILGAISGG